MTNRRKFVLFIALLCASPLSCHIAFAAPILFLSTQLTPLPEATMMRQTILKGFPHLVDFEPYDRTAFNARVANLVSVPTGAVVLGGLQEDFLRMYRAGALESTDSLWPALADRVFVPGFAVRKLFGTDRSFFVPWMQATYVMAANRLALPYLPKGANLDRLSYNELMQWAAAMRQATGKEKLGFPVGPKGLMARFLQGYLSPSFTGAMSNAFAGQAAVAMWLYLRDLWQYVSPSSLSQNRMDEALLNGEVWVAWDHTARLLEAFKKEPDKFVAFPAPIGPTGRGFISVLAGLGVPKGSSVIEAEKLIDYLTQPHVQTVTMESVGFLPVVEMGRDASPSKGLASLVRASMEQMDSPDAIFSSIPQRVADAGRSFDLVYTVAFSRIVLRHMSPEAVLERQEKILLEIEKNRLPVGGK
jgi:multiple sugar transport system substrate-binding protein